MQSCICTASCRSSTTASQCASFYLFYIAVDAMLHGHVQLLSFQPSQFCMLSNLHVMHAHSRPFDAAAAAGNRPEGHSFSSGCACIKMDCSCSSMAMLCLRMCISCHYRLVWAGQSKICDQVHASALGLCERCSGLVSRHLNSLASAFCTLETDSRKLQLPFQSKEDSTLASL